MAEEDVSLMDTFRKVFGRIELARDEDADQIAALKAELKKVRDILADSDDSLYWLLNLLHGQSKGGPEYSPPSDAEWEEAIDTGKNAHEQAYAYRAEAQRA